MSFNFKPEFAVVSFSIFEESSKTCLVAAGLSVYLQKNFNEFKKLSKDQIKAIITTRFRLNESTVDEALSILQKDSDVKTCYTSTQNPLTNAPTTSRLTNVVTESSGGKQNPPKEFVLNDSCFPAESPLYQIKELIIDWWKHHKNGVKSLQSWNLQKAEFRKIYFDPSVAQNIEALKQVLEIAISQSINLNKRWMSITYMRWCQYNKKHWIEYMSRAGAQQNSNGETIVPETGGPWLKKLQIPTE